MLTDDERELIEALFYYSLTEREYAAQKNVYHNAIHKKKMRILKKLKNFWKIKKSGCAEPQKIPFLR